MSKSSFFRRRTLVPAVCGVASLVALIGVAMAGDLTDVPAPDVGWQKPYARLSDRSYESDNADLLNHTAQSDLSVRAARNANTAAHVDPGAIAEHITTSGGRRSCGGTDHHGGSYGVSVFVNSAVVDGVQVTKEIIGERCETPPGTSDVSCNISYGDSSFTAVIFYRDNPHADDGYDDNGSTYSCTGSL